MTYLVALYWPTINRERSLKSLPLHCITFFFFTMFFSKAEIIVFMGHIASARCTKCKAYNSELNRPRCYLHRLLSLGIKKTSIVKWLPLGVNVAQFSWWGVLTGCVLLRSWQCSLAWESVNWVGKIHTPYAQAPPHQWEKEKKKKTQTKGFSLPLLELGCHLFLWPLDIPTPDSLAFRFQDFSQ